MDDKRGENLEAYLQYELPYYDYEEARMFYTIFEATARTEDRAFLGCNDRFYLLTHLLGRPDALHPWVYDRCREVEAEPDDCLDLWARYHYKSSIITFAGNIQDILCDPEITIAIFSISLKIAVPFVSQIKEEFEANELLKQTYPDVLYFEPRKEATGWTTHGITVKRATNPKEQTLEAHGLIEAMPTGRHFKKLVYDDVVTEKHIDNPDVVKKVISRIELSDNLGIGEHTRRQYIGTRYSFGDPYGDLLDRGLLKPRIYPATDDGKATGTPVFITQSEWDRIKITQHGTYSAQMLQNPAAGKEASFDMSWALAYWVRPRNLNVYIMGDPSLGKSAKSDSTAYAVIGIDRANKKYLLDGFCHKMDLKQRWENLKLLYRKWSNEEGTIILKVGYERYGMQSDIEYFKERQEIEKMPFEIHELNWTGEGNQSKKARVNRLQAPFKGGEFYLPALVYHEKAPICSWKLNEDTYEFEHTKMTKGKVTSDQARAIAEGRGRFLAKPLVRRDQSEGNLYDLTRVLLEEMQHFPYGAHDDMVDATSRYVDMKPLPAQANEASEIIEIIDD